MADTAAVPPSRPMSPARRRGQDAAPNRRNDLDRVEHRHTINTGGTAPKPTTNIKINNNSYTENLTGSAVRSSAAAGLLGENHAASAEPGRRPTSQPGDPHHRHHPETLRPAHPDLCEEQDRQRTHQTRSHPKPETPHRPRGLLPPPSRGLHTRAGSSITAKPPARRRGQVEPPTRGTTLTAPSTGTSSKMEK